jgi:MFS family permease
MVQKLTKQEFFSLILVLILLFVNNAVANMLIPSYGTIVLELGIPKSIIAIPDAFFTLVSAAFALLWGYYVDKIDRARVIIAGGFCWSFGTLATGFSINFEMLFLARMVTGAGMGCVLPAGYSILSDVIPEGERSGYFGNLAILSSVANGAGQGLSSFIGPLLTWRFPFLLMSMISVGIMTMLFFIKFPKRGTREGELAALKDLRLDYNFAISAQDLKAIFKKKTNRHMAVAGFFAIIPGTVIIFYLTAVFQTHFFLELPTKIALQTSSLFAAMVGIGYLLGNSILGGLGDKVFKRNRRNRVRLGTAALLLTIPGCLIMLFAMVKVDYNVVNSLVGYPTGEIPNDQIMSYVFSTIGAVFTQYPSYFFFLIFAVVGSFFSAGAVANRTAILIDVNLPEHRGTAVSFFNLAEQIGKGITLLIAGGLISVFSGIITALNFENQDPTHLMMITTIFLYIPTAIMWWKMQKTVVSDMDDRSIVLRERQQMSIIDYIFELEISLDGGLQKIYDARLLIPNNLMQALDKISEADKIFENVSTIAENRNMEDVQEKATKLRSMSKEILTDLHEVLRHHRDGTSIYQPDMTQIQMKIDEFPRSDLGKIEILYETGYLKVVEARLERKTNDVQALDDLESAIKIFERVEHLIQERLESLAYEGEEEVPRALLAKAKRSGINTIKLRDDLQKVFDELRKAGIEFEDMRKMTALTVEYNVPMQEVLRETLDAKRAEVIKAMSAEIDAIFAQYDQVEKTRPNPRV